MSATGLQSVWFGGMFQEKPQVKDDSARTVFGGKHATQGDLVTHNP